jgi:uncharacterized protein YfaS (alpha-2-macroglobulin family)
MAQAWTEEHFGMAEGKTVVAAPLIAELSAPRFLAGGDRTSLALDLANLSGRAQQLTCKSAPKAAEPGGQRPAERRPGRRPAHHLLIPVQAQGGLGQGKVQVRVNGLQLPGEPATAFEREWTLGVRPAYPAMLKHYRVALKDQPWSLPEATWPPSNQRAWKPAWPCRAARR